MFMLGEYVHMITTSFLLAILFFGGWHFPGLTDGAEWWHIALKLIVLCGKATIFIMLYMLIRWTLPRFRFDQLMGLAWKVMIPLALLNLVGVLVVKEFGWHPLWLLPLSLLLVGGTAAVAGWWPRAPARVLVVMRGHEQVETVVH